MPYIKLKENEIRAYAKEYLESLEYWLRILIDRELIKNFGSNYIEAKKDNGDYLFNKAIRDEIKNRFNSEQNRYPRLIDACLLDTAVKILSKKELYNLYFEKYLNYNFPLGREMVKVILEKLIYPRNCLYHANPISIRYFEQIICYTNDIIDSIKEYYKTNNMNQDYNVPKIMRITDSFGNSFFREQFDPADRGHVSIDLRNSQQAIYAGDKLKIELELDPTFPRDSYKIQWTSAKGIPQLGDTNPIFFDIEEKHIGESLDIRCSIISNEIWHRHEKYDDFVIIFYKVLPRK